MQILDEDPLATRILRDLSGKPGGLTLDLLGRVTKHTAGYYVALTNNQFHDYSEQAVAIALAHAANHPLAGFIGGWRAPDGRVYIDAVAHIACLEDALCIGRAYRQQAIYAIKEKESRAIR